MNQQRPLKDEPILSAAEFEDAILGAISDGTARGRARQLGLAILHQALQAVNPLQLATEDVVLFEKTDQFASGSTQQFDLNIKESTTRHNFNDNYFAFTFLFSRGNYPTKGPGGHSFLITQTISKPLWFNTQPSNGAAIRFDLGSSDAFIWKISDTRFAYNRGSGGVTGGKIIGHKLIFNLKTP